MLRIAVEHKLDVCFVTGFFIYFVRREKKHEVWGGDVGGAVVQEGLSKKYTA